MHAASVTTGTLLKNNSFITNEFLQLNTRLQERSQPEEVNYV